MNRRGGYESDDVVIEHPSNVPEGPAPGAVRRFGVTVSVADYERLRQQLAEITAAEHSVHDTPNPRSP